MRIDIFSIFPDQIDQMGNLSILGRARKSGLVDLRSQDLRMATTDKHRTVDDSPFGGGPGMVLKPEPVFAAVKEVSPPRPLIRKLMSCRSSMVLVSCVAVMKGWMKESVVI